MSLHCLPLYFGHKKLQFFMYSPYPSSEHCQFSQEPWFLLVDSG